MASAGASKRASLARCECSSSVTRAFPPHRLRRVPPTVVGEFGLVELGVVSAGSDALPRQRRDPWAAPQVAGPLSLKEGR